MELICGQCGRTIVVEDSLEDGQNVLCPFCGKESRYSAPSRIELPDATSKHKPEIYARRVEQPKDIADRIAREKVRSVENRARIVEELKDHEARRKRWGFIANLAGSVLLIIGMFVGFDVWRTRKEKAEIAQAEEQLLKAQAEAEKLEAERVHLQEMKALREKEAAERELARQAKIAENEAERAKIKAERERFGSYVLTIRKANLAFISDLEKLDPQPTEIAYLLPRVDNRIAAFVVVERQTNGTEQVYALTKTGERETVDRELFEKRRQEQDYLVVVGQKVYFRSSRKKQHVGQLGKQKVEDLSNAFFGMMAEDVKSLDPDFANLSFEIVFVPDPKKPKEFTIVDVVEFGSSYALGQVRDTIAENYPPKSIRLARSKSRKYKRHYRFWDGSHIKTGIDGVTYVPRIEPQGRIVSVRWSGCDRVYTTGRSSAEAIRWANLKSKVEEEERDEEAFYREQEERRRAAYAALTKTAQQKYQEELDQIMNDGALFFRAKLK